MNKYNKIMHLNNINKMKKRHKRYKIVAKIKIIKTFMKLIDLSYPMKEITKIVKKLSIKLTVKHS